MGLDETHSYLILGINWNKNGLVPQL